MNEGKLNKAHSSICAINFLTYMDANGNDVILLSHSNDSIHFGGNELAAITIGAALCLFGLCCFLCSNREVKARKNGFHLKGSQNSTSSEESLINYEELISDGVCMKGKYYHVCKSLSSLCS